MRRKKGHAKSGQRVKAEHSKDIFWTEGASTQTDTEMSGRVAGTTLPDDFFILKLQILTFYILKNTFLSTF